MTYAACTLVNQLFVTVKTSFKDEFMIGIAYFKINESSALKVLDSLKGKAKLINLEHYDGKYYDTIVSVGGDGTFAKSVSITKFNKIVGVKPESSIGAHCACCTTNWPNYVKRLLTSDYKTIECSKLRTMVNSKLIDHAVNEVVISALTWGRTLKYELVINHEPSIKTLGSALFIYTTKGYSGFLKKLINPFGKKKVNAYFKNSDGIAGIASDYGFNSYKKLLPGYEVKVKIVSDAYLSIDGAKTELRLKPGDVVKVTSRKYKAIKF